MKGLPQRELRRAAGQLQLASVASSPTLAHGLTYGVDLLPLHPIDAARAGATARIPLIIGTNLREASLFARDKPPMLPTTPETVDRYFDQHAGEAKARVLATYGCIPWVLGGRPRSDAGCNGPGWHSPARRGMSGRGRLIGLVTTPIDGQHA